MAGFINEPLAASVIYPATLAAWTFLALFTWQSATAIVASLTVFCVFFVISMGLIRRIKGNWHRCPEWLEFQNMST